MAAKSLGETGDNIAVPHLIIALSDSVEIVRVNAAEALGKLGDKSAVPGLIKLLSDSNNLWLVRSASAEALGKLQDDSSIPHLMKALADPDESVRANAAQALNMIREKRGLSRQISASVETERKLLHTTVEGVKTVSAEETASSGPGSGEPKKVNTQVKIGAYGQADPFSICPYCGKELKLPKTPHFCPYCKEKLVVDR